MTARDTTGKHTTPGVESANMEAMDNLDKQKGPIMYIQAILVNGGGGIERLARCDRALIRERDQCKSRLIFQQKNHGYIHLGEPMCTIMSGTRS